MIFPFPIPPPEEMYPKAPPMPAPVAETVEELLGRFEELLQERAPDLLDSLQPGLTKARIARLEKRYQFAFPHDLRALYRWRNGSPYRTRPDVFAGHRFVPLDEAVKTREVGRRQQRSAPMSRRLAYEALLSFSEEWLDLIIDLCGDGYRFDPGRSEAEGSFFFNFLEDGRYVFFPAFRNFLAGTLKGHETGVFHFVDGGAETVDYARAHKLWRRYGEGNPRPK